MLPAMDDPVLAQIGDAIGLSTRGDASGARTLLLQLWQAIGEAGDPLHRCAAAHSLADVVVDPHDQLTWDLRALAAADELTDARVEAAGMATTVAAMYPSLHLNLGEAYRKVGDRDRALDHLARGRETLVHVIDEGTREMFDDAFARLAERLVLTLGPG